MAVLLTTSQTFIGRHVPDLKRKRHRSGEDGLESKNKGKFAKMTQSTLMDRRSLEVRRRVFRAENLHCDYFNHFYSREEAKTLMRDCEESLEYFTGDLAIVKLYGKTIPIPRKQVAHGDEGLTYTFSRVTVPAKPWLPFLETVRKRIEDQTSFKFNFVLINRYKDGKDCIGEHRDDEKDLDPQHPIASLSLGQTRDFVFRHKDSRGKKKTREIETVKIALEHGSLLMMNHPTNQYWYHSLPRKATQSGVRINMTFRKILRQAEDKN
ncbi:putative alpha-ketoglutarate-dependent dioxygenase alkB-like 2 [Apostichopus japonicus]|uniref:DNA oxidative demethylase ALKBH2 n=1 Tax=Stichopus japonicus TaxID=307972 RepID=A0A2G8JT43_STIJA|nr:putative alpha-ketoglutarate-dependent dioxygenase alkB-like 2 [Apostichopus japonicus]